MLAAKFIIGVALFWVIGSIVGLALTGLYMGDSFLTVLQNGTSYNVVQVSSAGVLTLPKLGPLTYLAAIPTMIAWNFPMLVNEWSIVKVFLWPISFGIVIGLTALVAAGLQGIFARFT